MSLAAGYGVQMWPVVQDIHQLRGIYGDRWQTFLSNAGLVQFFTPNDMETAEYISKRAGITTRQKKSFEDKGCHFPNRKVKVSKNEGFIHPDAGLIFRDTLQEDHLLSTGSVLDMPNDKQVSFCAGTKAVFYEDRQTYWTIPALQGLYDENPYHKS